MRWWDGGGKKSSCLAGGGFEAGVSAPRGLESGEQGRLQSHPRLNEQARRDNSHESCEEGVK